MLYRSTLPGGDLILADGEVPYDTLIVATGAQNDYFGNQAWPCHCARAQIH